MVNTETILRNAGLSDKEAKVYLALLELGEGGPTEISKLASIKRPTTYLALGNLYEKHLVVSRKNRGRELYRAVNPFAILKAQRDNCSLLEQAIPIMLKHQSNEANSPSLEVKVGVDAISWYWQDGLTAQTDILYWADAWLAKGVPSLFNETQTGQPETFDAQTIIAERVKRGIWVRGIIPYEPDSKRLRESGLSELQKEYLYLKRLGASELREFYFVSRNSVLFDYELATYDDKVFLVSYQESLVVYIRSKQLASGFRGMFSLAFTQARLTENECLTKADNAYLEKK